MVNDVKKYVAACKDYIMEKWDKPIMHTKIITIDGPLKKVPIKLIYVLAGPCHFLNVK